MHYEILTLLGDEKCYHVNTRGQDYIGLVSVNDQGHNCQRWDSMYPYAHSYLRFAGGSNSSEAANRCRNPYTLAKPWCHHATKRGWAYCSVPPCIGEFNLKYVSKLYTFLVDISSVLRRLLRSIHFILHDLFTSIWYLVPWNLSRRKSVNQQKPIQCADAIYLCGGL